MFQVGDTVRFISEERHERDPEYFPPIGTTGQILSMEGGFYRVRWESGSTSNDDVWYVKESDIEFADK